MRATTLLFIVLFIFANLAVLASAKKAFKVHKSHKAHKNHSHAGNHKKTEKVCAGGQCQSAR
jgi:hypothetical protein